MLVEWSEDKSALLFACNLLPPPPILQKLSEQSKIPLYSCYGYDVVTVHDPVREFFSPICLTVWDVRSMRLSRLLQACKPVLIITRPLTLRDHQILRYCSLPLALFIISHWMDSNMSLVFSSCYPAIQTQVIFGFVLRSPIIHLDAIPVFCEENWEM